MDQPVARIMCILCHGGLKLQHNGTVATVRQLHCFQQQHQDQQGDTTFNNRFEKQQQTNNTLAVQQLSPKARGALPQLAVDSCYELPNCCCQHCCCVASDSTYHLLLFFIFLILVISNTIQLA